MKVEVRLFATFAGYLPEGARGDSASLDVAEGATVGQVIQSLRIPTSLPCLVVVNGRDAAPEQVLADGDVLAMFPPLAGGQDPGGGAASLPRRGPCLRSGSETAPSTPKPRRSSSSFPEAGSTTSSSSPPP